MTDPQPGTPDKPDGVPTPIKFIAAVLVLAAVGGIVFFLIPPDPYSLRRSDWRTFTARFVESDGRVVDTGNGGVSHSEGQGYGMLLAVAFNDRRTFSRMWDWTRKNLRRPGDNFFAWLWTPEGGGKIQDPNNASDGDLLIAWALLRAFERWGDLEYQREAGIILTEFQQKSVVATGLGPQMIPGQIGFEVDGGVVLNPSYVVFPAYKELVSTFPAPIWQQLIESGDALIERSRFGEWGLTANWVLVGENAETVRIAPGKPTDFGYDAIRVPLHIAWYNPQSESLKPFAAFWNSLPPGSELPATVNLETNEFGPYPALPGMLAVIQLTRAAVSKSRITVREIPEVDDEEPYYSASLKLLVGMAISEAFRPEKH